MIKQCQDILLNMVLTEKIKGTHIEEGIGLSLQVKETDRHQEWMFFPPQQ
jgi:hypothetical protein